MKKTLKTWLAALLCVGAATATAADLPEFSTVDAPHWYQVNFTRGGAILSAFESGVLKTEAPRGGASVDWQLIGTQDEFLMKNRAGKYVGWQNGFYVGVDNESAAAKLHLNAFGSDAWEIGREGSERYMNQYQGYGVGRSLSEWDTQDPNNGLIFKVPAEGEDPQPEFSMNITETPVSSPLDASGLPQLSNDTESHWYFIRFSSGNIISCPEFEAVITTAKATDDPNYLWKFVGADYNNVQIVSIRGAYLNDANRYVSASKTPSATGYKIVASGSDSFEIEALGASDNNRYFNQDGGTGVGVKVGLWTKGDTNNPLKFVTIADMVETFAEQKLRDEEMNAFIGDVEHLHPGLAEYAFTGSETYKPEHPLTLWYKRPGTVATHSQRWMHMGLPIGNGQFGATVLGGIRADEISYNDKTLWTGEANIKTGSYSYGCYQSFGTVYIEDLPADGAATDVTDFWRNLDLTEGVANLHYIDANGVTFERQYLASNPDGVIAVRLTADKPGAINKKFFVVPGMNKNQIVTYEGNTASFKGRFPVIRFASEMRVIPDNADAAVTATADGIEVKGADAVTVILAGGTNFDPVDLSFTNGQTMDELAASIAKRVDDASGKGWDAIRADHVADHQSLFNRVDLAFDGAVNELPTDELIVKYQTTKSSTASSSKKHSLMLEQLYFAYGRYLLIGSSRGVDSPANLQGIWSGYDVQRPFGGSQVAPWNADIHNNINLQMCYWPAENTNLSELHNPMLNYLIINATIQPRWREYARQSGQTKGWTFFTESSIYNGSGSFMWNYTVANAWCATHLWQHYLYTLDKDFLKRAFPTMWSAAEFWLERMVKAKDGTWECPNEYSPEHGPSENATAHSQQLVWELFDECRKAIDILGDEAGLSADDIALLNERFENMDRGIAFETYDGKWGETCNGLKSGSTIMREWKYSDYSKGSNGHRHNSHLMCLHPYAQVEAGTPEFEAAVNSLQLRGDGATGWSMGWKINLWARAHNGNHARTIIKNALAPASENMANQGGSGVYNNLFDSHSPFQIDGNFGYTSGVAEMLMQSHAGIHLLPALPTYWKGGAVRGLKAQGDMTVDIVWEAGKVKEAVIIANQGGDVKVVNADMDHLRIAVDGVAVEPLIKVNEVTKTRTITIPGVAVGAKVTLTYDADYNNPNVESSINEVEAGNGIALSVSNGTVTASGDVVSLNVYDLSGRQLVAVASNSAKVPASAGSIVIVRATAANGAAATAKVIL